MRLSSDQKRMVKTGLAMLIVLVFMYPLVDWIWKGAFSWDAVLTGLLSAVITGLLFTLLIIGSHTPEKKE